jgi:hypothetical protein
VGILGYRRWWGDGKFLSYGWVFISPLINVECSKSLSPGGALTGELNLFYGLDQNTNM